VTGWQWLGIAGLSAYVGFYLWKIAAFLYRTARTELRLNRIERNGGPTPEDMVWMREDLKRWQDE
jgi:hypothetical protein